MDFVACPFYDVYLDQNCNFQAVQASVEKAHHGIARPA
jgi:hypothetical protein